jgi:hypothetical protein
MSRFAPLPLAERPPRMRWSRRPATRGSICAIAVLGAALLSPLPASAAPVDESSYPVTPSAHTGATTRDESSSPEAPAPETPTAPTPTVPAHSGRCTLSVAASSAQVISGEPVTLTGALACADTEAAEGVEVTILARVHESGGSSLNELGTATTQADGTYEFTTPAVAANSTFVVRAPRASSARTVVKVAPAVTIRGPVSGSTLFTRGNAGAHNRLTFSGSVSPTSEGARVALQREYAGSGEQWHTIALTRVDSEGHYSVTHGFKIPGKVSVRVVVRPKGPSTLAISEALSYTVAQTQNPRLTIQASADPDPFGQPVTVTGVAAGAPGQTVALLTRTPGSSYAVLDKVKTDAAGAYSFTVSPLQNTYYRVTSATTTSSQLFEGSRYTLLTGPWPATVEDGSPLTLTGSLPGASAGQVLLEQHYGTGLAFHVVAVGTVASDSSFSVTQTFHGVAQRVLRLKLQPSAAHLATTSPEFTVSVTPHVVASPEGEDEAAPEAPAVPAEGEPQP